MSHVNSLPSFINLSPPCVVTPLFFSLSFLKWLKSLNKVTRTWGGLLVRSEMEPIIPLALFVRGDERDRTGREGRNQSMHQPVVVLVSSRNTRWFFLFDFAPIAIRFKLTKGEPCPPFVVACFFFSLFVFCVHSRIVTRLWVRSC